MATKSGGLEVGVGFTQIATAGVGQEAAVFGLVFSNTTAAERTVTLRLYVQSEGVAVDIAFTLAAKERTAWEKAIGLQPGDTLAVAADAVGVGLIFSTDTDDGTNPVESGLVPRGPYSAVADYDVNHYVELDGKSWVSLVSDNIGNDPPTSPAEWMLLVEANQGMVDAAVAAGLAAIDGGAPPDLNTLAELAAAINEDPDFSTTVAASLAARVPMTREVTGAGLLAGQGGALDEDLEFTLTPATPTEIRAGNTNGAPITPDGQDDSLERVLVADAATIAWDLALAPDGVVTIAASRTVGAPTNAKPGKFYSLLINSTGAFTPAFNACFDFGSTGAGTFPSGAGKYGVLDAECISVAPLKFRSNLWKGA